MSKLFSPIKVGEHELINRIVIPPMCQYSAEDGKAMDWHLIHYGSLAKSGAALMILEACAIAPEGRLSPFDLGLWGEEQLQSMKSLITSIQQYSSIKIAVQLVHAGRKASMPQPWMDEKWIPVSKGGWKTFAPSAIAFNSNYDLPLELTIEQIKMLIQQFADAAIRADKAGIDMIEVHAAHGYLIHQFLSPLTNQRTDEYGGSLENRMRFAIEVFQAVRAALPKQKGVGIRLSATDWVEGGWDLDQSIQLAKKLDALGCSYIHVSSGGLDPRQKISARPNYQIPFATAIKAQVRMPVIGVGLITKAQQAEAILIKKEADMIAIGRGMLFNPHWAWQAAVDLCAQVTAPPQYLRSAPHGAKNLFK